LKAWLPFQPEFLSEFIQREGRQGATTGQCTCGQLDALYRCWDCFGLAGALTCSACMVAKHKNLPFHKVKKWNGKFFERTTLADLGLEIQVGHMDGTPCHNSQLIKNFVILDISGIHSVKLRLCACARVNEAHIQLLRADLFPATVTTPQTAATFRLLEIFEILSYESKITVLELYQALFRITDNTRADTSRERYSALLRIVREWRHLKLLKRGGRGHDPAGVAATGEGECAVLCPACPQPGKNMSPGWETASEEDSFLHALFIGIDANFRLKRKGVSSDKLDPGLGQGIAYIVEERAYKEHLAKHMNDKEQKSSCSNHNAVNLMDTKPGKEYAATGLVKVECIRHEFHRPCGAGDLQRGERYCNTDYVLFKTLRDFFLRRLFVSYDIACQYAIHILQRMSEISPDSRLLDENVRTTFLVPKFHLAAHIIECRSKFSFNYTPGVGRTDGEGVERAWSELNHLAGSTREMGPGFRRDTLDSHFGDANWRKYIGIGPALLRKLNNAGLQMAKQHGECQGKEETAREHYPQWLAEMKAWEEDPGQPNPLVSRIAPPTCVVVCQAVAKAEAVALMAKQNFKIVENMTPLELIHTTLSSHATQRQRDAYSLHEDSLKLKVKKWFKRQAAYIPGVMILRPELIDETTEEEVEFYSGVDAFDIPLWLPSQIKAQVDYDLHYANIEWELCLGQAYEAISAMRRNLFHRAHLRNYKKTSIQGQAANTRAQNTINNVQASIDVNAATYRAARDALNSLSIITQRTARMSKFPVLLKEDIRELSELEPKKSDGTSTSTWIWRMEGLMVEKDNVFALEDHRVQWAKAYCRAMRFTEEVQLVQAEMHRVLRFLRWQENRWKIKAEIQLWPKPVTTELQDGLSAYAFRQAEIQHQIHQRFCLLWDGVEGYVKGLQTQLKATGSAHYRPLLIQKEPEMSFMVVS
ncbi:hypothetical protein BDN72DRAFT_777650, partial [Pluteus cervinus]